MKTIKIYSSFLARHQLIFRSSQGFTLIELMLAMAISAVLMIAIFSVHTAQQKSYTAQQQVAEMQQNLRAALWIMTGELRMAGYDQSGSAKDSSCNVGATGNSIAPGIVSLTAGRIDFSMDLNGDNDCADERENLSYYVSTVNGIPSIIRLDNNITPQLPDEDNVIAENFDAIEFLYLDSAGGGTTDPEEIRSVQLSVLARAGEVDRHFTNKMEYIPASGNANPPWGNHNDNYRRRLMITNITCRNMKI